MAASVLTLAGITALATLIPALRAAGTQPVAALRHQ
jgi:ABC-type lipoprotein release transport system permease subunit